VICIVERNIATGVVMYGIVRHNEEGASMEQICALVGDKTRKV
jgi:hypothetical protein